MVEDTYVLEGEGDNFFQKKKKKGEGRFARTAQSVLSSRPRNLENLSLLPSPSTLFVLTLWFLLVGDKDSVW